MYPKCEVFQCKHYLSIIFHFFKLDKDLFDSNFVHEYNFHVCNLSENALGSRETFHCPTGSSCIDSFMVPSDISKYVIGFETLYEQTLNTSDHCPVAISVNFGNVPRNFIEQTITKRPDWTSCLKLIYTANIPHRSQLN